MELRIDFRKFVRVAHDGGLLLVPSDGGRGGRRQCGFSVTKQPRQSKGAGELAAIGLGWPTVGLGWCGWPLR